MIEIREADKRAAAYIGAHLSYLDYAELKIQYANSGLRNSKILRGAYEASTKGKGICKAIYKNGVPVAIFGAAEVEGSSRCATVWLMGTSEINKVGSFIIKQSVRFLGECFKSFDYLFNVVYARRGKTVKWLKWCGFLVREEYTILHKFNQPFYLFYMDKSDYVSKGGVCATQ